MKEFKQFDTDWEVIAGKLPTGWRELAYDMGLIKPQPTQLHTKVTDPAVPLRLALFHAATDSSLQVTAATAAAAKVADLSSVALHYWMRKLAPYLATLLSRLWDTSSLFLAPRWAGYEVIGADASVITRPGSQGTDARVHYALRLSDLRLLALEATDDKGGESFKRFAVSEGQLWLGDRIYCNPPGIAHVKARGGEVLVRYNRGALPLYVRGKKRFPLLAKVRQLRRTGQQKDWLVFFRGQDEQIIRGRLCALRLSEEQAEAARRRLRKEMGSKRVSAEALELCAYVLVFTTVPRARLSCEQVLELYRLRWQLELQVKRDKTIGGLDGLPTFRADTSASWLYAKLLAQELGRRLATESVAFPPGGGDVGKGTPLDRKRRAGSERSVAGDELHLEAGL
jgi:hypothetical protein